MQLCKGGGGNGLFRGSAAFTCSVVTTEMAVRWQRRRYVRAQN